jgi:hypothetical protein
VPLQRLRPGSAAQVLHSEFVFVSVVFIAWRLALTLISYLLSPHVARLANGGHGAASESTSFDYWTSWAQWDGGWYTAIAENAYADVWSIAYFPLYPFLMRAIDYVVGDAIATGLLISHLAFLGFLYVFFRLVKDHAGVGTARATILTFLTFPTAYFGVAVYSEALFLLLVALSLWSLRSDRLLAASFFAGLSAATRLVGVAAFVPVGLYALQRWDWRPATLVRWTIGAVLCLAPIGGYMFYLWREHGDPLYFVEISSAWWRKPDDPVSTFIHYVQDPPVARLNMAFDVITSLGFLAVLLLGVRRIPFSWWAYSLLVVLIAMSSGMLMSMPRYVLASLGAFVILGLFLEKRPVLKWPLWAAGFAFQAYLATLFLNGHWTA